MASSFLFYILLKPLGSKDTENCKIALGNPVPTATVF